MKSRTLAAILNLLLWGLGYLYLGRRRAFAALAFLAYVFEHLAVLLIGFGTYAAWPYLLFAVGHSLLSIGFAIDAYHS